MPTRIKNYSTAVVTLTIALLFSSEAIAQRGSSSLRGSVGSRGSSLGSRGSSIGSRGSSIGSRGSSIGSRGISRGTSSIGRGTSSIRSTVTRPPRVGGVVSGRTRLQSNLGTGSRIGTGRRVPNSASRIPSLNQRYSGYSNRRSTGSTIGLFIGSTPRYGIGGYSNYGYGYGSPYSGYGYNNYYVTPQVNTVVVPGSSLTYGQQVGTTVVPQVRNMPLLGNTNVAPVNSANVIATPQPELSPVVTNTTTQQRTGLPRNIIPASSLLTEGAPDISEPGKAILYNPSQSGGSVTYLLNGNKYTIRPGEAQGVELNRTWKLQFHRGLNEEDASYTLAEGIHKFRVGNRGWEVVRTVKKTVEAQKTPGLPAPPAPVEGPSIQPEPETEPLQAPGLETIRKTEKPAAEPQVTNPALQTPTDLPPTDLPPGEQTDSP